MTPSLTQMWMPEDFGRWGIRGIDDVTVEKPALLPQKVDEGSASGPSPRAHTAPVVAGDKAQHGPSGLRSDAAGSHTAA